MHATAFGGEAQTHIHETAVAAGPQNDYVCTFFLGKGSIRMQLPLGANYNENMYETALMAGPQTDYVCTFLLGTGPISKHAFAC